jgi:hypothetical protein
MVWQKSRPGASMKIKAACCLPVIDEAQRPFSPQTTDQAGGPHESP